jgi:tetratricopeptide (TPR) repeat protein
MPRVATGVLDTFPDHTLDVPNPPNTIAHGVPNACNVCHKDRSPDAMQQAIDAWWPNARARQQRRLLLADAIDEKTRDASRAPLEQVIRNRAEAPTLRAACAILLAQRFPSDAAGVIAPLLADADPLVRSRFTEALGYANARSAADDVARLLGDPSIRVREMSALVLSSFRDPRATPALEKLAADPATRNLARPHIALAIAAANRGDLDRAKRELDLVVDEVPYATDALVMLGDIAMRQGDRAAAKGWFEEALRFDPAHRGAHARLAAIR